MPLTQAAGIEHLCTVPCTFLCGTGSLSTCARLELHPYNGTFLRMCQHFKVRIRCLGSELGKGFKHPYSWRWASQQSCLLTGHVSTKSVSCSVPLSSMPLQPGSSTCTECFAQATRAAWKLPFPTTLGGDWGVCTSVFSAQLRLLGERGNTTEGENYPGFWSVCPTFPHT